MDIYKDMQCSSKFIMEKLSILNEHCNREEYMKENVRDEKSHSALASNFYLKTEYGKNSLMYIFEVLKLNQKRFQELLNPDEIQEKVHSCNLYKSFDPLNEFNCVGDKVLNHYQMLEIEYDWPVMIKTIPLSRVKALLVNRFEFQPESASILNSDEVSAVSEINNILNLNNNTQD